MDIDEGKRKTGEGGKDRLLRTGTVAKLLGSDPRTVARWARRKTNALPSIRTPGGQFRFEESLMLKVRELGVEAYMSGARASENGEHEDQGSGCASCATLTVCESCGATVIQAAA